MQYISRADVETMVDQVFANKFHPKAEFNFRKYMDTNFYLPTPMEAKGLVAKLGLTGHNGGLGEGFDCEDFSYAMKGGAALYNRDFARKPFSWAVGIIWGEFKQPNEYHSMNWIILRDRSIWLLEPQLGTFHDTDHCTGNISLMIL